MKIKLSIITLFLFFSFKSIASNNFNSVSHSGSKTSQLFNISEPPNFFLISELCFEAEFYFGECPDGSTFLGAILVLATDCETGVVEDGLVINVESYESCFD